LGKVHRLAERRQEIVNVLSEAGQLSVLELSDRFDVSEVTIRQDLQALSEQGLLQRTRGGALSINALPEFSYDVRQQQKSVEKRLIGQTAASLVHYGDIIFLDASTTAHAIVPHLKKLSELTVITNSLKIAMSLLDAPHIQVLLPGGSLRRTSISLVGQPQGSFLEGLNIEIGFFGARGLAVPEGLTDVEFNEVQMKRSIAERCRRVVGVLDARKWGRVAAATFADLNQIDIIISDPAAPEDLVAQVRRYQIEVLLV
jgi:DeoR family fructose operon transcriptional repressor